MNGNEVIKAFKKLTDITTFEELNIPLTTVTTDIVKNEKIECNSGDLINAIKASIAIPGVLNPTYINDRLCVDGGLIDPVPLESVIKMGADHTIAVNLYGLKSSEKKNEQYNIIDIIDRSVKIVLKSKFLKSKFFNNFFIILNSSSNLFTSSNEVPDPYAIFSFLLFKIKEGLFRS